MNPNGLFPYPQNKFINFTLIAGTAVPQGAGSLPHPLAFGAKDETPQNGFDALDTAIYSYVLGKFGNDAYLFYIGNLAGPVSLPTSLGGNGDGLSHQVAFTSTPITRVPDSGATAMLLGLGLMGLGSIRRYLCS